MIAIISCGTVKLPEKHRAKDLYVGIYFKSCLRYCLSILPENKIFILSAKHGILKLSQEVESYDLKMGDPGSIDLEKVKIQAQELGIQDEDVICLAGSNYKKIVQEVWGKVKFPLKGLTIGYAMRALKRNIGRFP